MEYAHLRLVRSKRQGIVASSTPEAECVPFINVAGSREETNTSSSEEEDEDDQISVNGGDMPREHDAERELVRYHQEEHEVRDEKEKIARARPQAWCDFCGKRVVNR